jgi:hypothetical protein
MRQVTTRNRQCGKTCLTKLKRVVKEVVRANGRHERRRCLLNSIKRMVEAIETNAKETVTKEPKQMDFSEVANQKW